MVLLSPCAFNPRMEQPMSFSSLWNWIGGPSRPARKPAGRRPRVEALEDRAVPATLIGLTNQNQLLTFDSAAPSAILSTVTVRGVPRTERLLGIDTRPSTGQLYATSDRSLYTIDTTTGRATRIAVYSTARPGLVATGLDFNPVVDRLRITTTTGRNLRVNPDNGAVTVDAALAYATGDTNVGKKPAVVGSAYTNPDNDPATTTALFGIDFQQNVLVSQASPNDGQLTTVGALGVDISAIVGFDVASGTAFASLSTAAAPRVPHLYTINLTTGAATDAGVIGAGNRVVIGLTAALPAQPVYAVTNTNQLVTFNAAAPEIITSSRAITGLSTGESITGIDFRPSTGELYGTSTLNRVYVINTVTGAATRVNGAVFAGDQFGVDFNPAADALRIVSDSEQNLRITNGGRGTVNSDTAPAYVAGDTNVGDNPNVVGVAYTNNFPGATTTTLFGIDTLNNVLVRIGGVDGTPSPNTGELTTIGTGLGVDPDATDFVGFDVSSGGTAYSAMRLTGQTVSRFFTINLTTGAATAVQGTGAVADGVASNEGIIGSLKGGSPTIVGIAVAPPLVHFQTVAPSVREGPSVSARLVVLRSGDTTATSTVNFGLIPETAKTPDDFTTPATLTLTFDPGETFATFEVPIINDTSDEPTETFAAVLTKAPLETFTVDPALAQAIVSIIDND
jgi:hypothetical protein